jgi:hypothetical protein
VSYCPQCTSTDWYEVGSQEDPEVAKINESSGVTDAAAQPEPGTATAGGEVVGAVPDPNPDEPVYATETGPEPQPGHELPDPGAPEPLPGGGLPEPDTEPTTGAPPLANIEVAVEDVPDGTIPEVRAWVFGKTYPDTVPDDGWQDRARAALEAEEAKGDKSRTSWVAELEGALSDTEPEQ